jgi:hypothetical protein
MKGEMNTDKEPQMQKLSRDDLMSLEEYAEQRQAFRATVMEHKKDRQVELGNNARLYFEDRMTIQYQIQEMLRIEKVFEAEGINEELEAYNPLIPDGMNWKATFMLEYPDADERRVMVTKLKGIEQLVWVQIQGFDKVYAIADEDLAREDEEKTSTVHFLRFELTAPMIVAAKKGEAIQAGIDHENYKVDSISLSSAIHSALVADLDNVSIN